MYLDDGDNDNNPATTTRVTVELDNNLVVENSTDGFGGGLDLFIVAFSDTEGTMDLGFNTIASNSAVSGAGGVSLSWVRPSPCSTEPQPELAQEPAPIGAA